jgi:hypothetical protein
MDNIINGSNMTIWISGTTTTPVGGAQDCKFCN